MERAMDKPIGRVRTTPQRRGNKVATWVACGLFAAMLPLGAMAQTQLAPLINENAPKRIPGQYIVVFKQGVAKTTDRKSVV